MILKLVALMYGLDQKLDEVTVIPASSPGSLDTFDHVNGLVEPRTEPQGHLYSSFCPFYCAVSSK